MVERIKLLYEALARILPEEEECHRR
jgi:hypothetical protein